MGGNNSNKGRICVTGGTGYLGSWMVKRLLQDGYSVNTTIRDNPDNKRDISFLTNLPGASERLQIFHADLDHPDTFAASIHGCTGLFHVAQPLDFEDKESEETKVKRITNGTLGILQACLEAKTVKRVVYTSSVAAAAASQEAAGSELVDESFWTDVDRVRRLGRGSYKVTKALTERLALDFGEKNGLDVVCVLPGWVHGPFIGPRCPESVCICMALIFGDKKNCERLMRTCLVHVDDVARAHIHLFEYPNAKGRYICSSNDITIDELHQLLSARYPQFQIPSPDSWKEIPPVSFPGLSSKKLLETGFKFENGLEEMFDGAIKSCKEIRLL
ncbi:Flavonol reductase/cinnamoyl-CoA reductase [Handroanthus impetiginosus]|uniref:Dihydroflavonol 4-reductase n=1 Tax=Handroanthus impetiginosus TaxID=429701 RepID=A0A2G9I7M6_9LAMI|nr:Flavonol reductase/cinnamoyl-CoA reductase [Handroanthus impetiginosus]